MFLIARYLPHPDTPFNDKLMKWGFWLLNLAVLVLMIVSKLISNRYYSGYAEVSPEGLRYARSEEFMPQPLFDDTLRWVRLGGDVSIHLQLR
ncbi:MAG: hypothetical protein ACLR5N_08465 [Haemophilus parainfluenzae]